MMQEVTTRFYIDIEDKRYWVVDRFDGIAFNGYSDPSEAKMTLKALNDIVQPYEETITKLEAENARITETLTQIHDVAIHAEQFDALHYIEDIFELAQKAITDGNDNTTAPDYAGVEAECDVCEGTGKLVCWRCNGVGWEEIVNGVRPCLECDSQKTLECQDCNGTGCTVLHLAADDDTLPVSVDVEADSGQGAS